MNTETEFIPYTKINSKEIIGPKAKKTLFKKWTNDLNRYLTTEDRHMENKHMEICTSFLLWVHKSKQQ